MNTLVALGMMIVSLGMVIGFTTLMITLWVHFQRGRVKATIRRADVLSEAARRLAHAPETDSVSAVGDLLDQHPWLRPAFDEHAEQCWQVGDKTYNHEQARAYFTPGRFAPTVRGWLDVVPGLLTGLGILGTFIGIVIGLSPLAGAFTGSAPSTIGTAVGGLVHGLLVSFLTSIVGLVLSLHATARAASAASKLEDAVTEVVDTLDRRVQRAVAPRLLQEIVVRHHAIQEVVSNQAHVMQRSLMDITRILQNSQATRIEAHQQAVAHADALKTELKAITESVHKAVESGIQSSGLIEAMNAMAQTLANSQRDGAGQLLDQFADKFSGGLGDTFAGLGVSIEKMVKANAIYQTGMGELVASLHGGIEHQVEASRSVEQTVAQIGAAAQALKSTVTALSGSASEINKASLSMNAAIAWQRSALEDQRAVNQGVVAAVEAQTRGWAEHQRAIVGAHDALQDRFGALRASVDALVTWHDRVHSALKDQVEAWVAGIAEQHGVIGLMSDERRGWRALVGELATATTAFSALGDQLAGASAALGVQVDGLQGARAAVESGLVHAAGALRTTLTESQEATAAHRGLLRSLNDSLAAERDRWERTAGAVGSAQADLAGRLAEVGQAVDRLVTWHDHIRGGLEDQAAQWRAALDVQRSLTETIAAERGSWAQMLTDLRGTAGGMKALGDQLHGLAGRMGDGVQHLQQSQSAGVEGVSKAVAQLREVGDLFGGSWEQYGEVARGLSASLPDITTLLGGLGAAVDRQQAIVDEARKVAEEFRATREVQAQLVEGLKQLVDASQQTSIALAPTTKELGAAAAQLQQTVGGLSALGDRVGSVGDRMAASAKDLESRESQRLESWNRAVEQLGKSADAFQRTLVANEKALETYAKGVNDTTERSLRGFDEALGKAVRELRGALQALSETVEELRADQEPR